MIKKAIAIKPGYKKVKLSWTNTLSFLMIVLNGNYIIFQAEFKKLCKNLTADQVEVTFARFDKAGNGKLNYREFCGMMNAQKMKKAKALQPFIA